MSALQGGSFGLTGERAGPDAWTRSGHPLNPDDVWTLVLHPESDEAGRIFPALPSPLDAGIGALGLYATGVEGSIRVVNPLEEPLPAPVSLREGPVLPVTESGDLSYWWMIWQL